MIDAPDAALHEAVERAVGRPVDELRDVVVDPLDYDAFLAHRAVRRIRGTALAPGEAIPWRLIEKITEGPHLAIPYLTDNGEREYAAYASGLLDDLAPGIRAPQVYGSAVAHDGRLVLWLEEIVHEGARPLDADALLAASRDLGRLGGRWLGRELDAPWLFRGWIDRHSQPQAAAAGLATVRRRSTEVVARLGAARLEATERLILAQPRLRDLLEALPATLCHHDAVGANVFRSGGGTVLIDWESAGPGPVGADVASLLFSVRRGDASSTVVVPLVQAAFDQYVAGIREEAPRMDTAAVRLGVDAAIGLRWKLAVDVADSVECGEVPRRGSRPDEPPEEALEELIALVDVLLAAAARVLD